MKGLQVLAGPRALATRSDGAFTGAMQGLELNEPTGEGDWPEDVLDELKARPWNEVLAYISASIAGAEGPANDGQVSPAKKVEPRPRTLVLADVCFGLPRARCLGRLSC